MIELKGIYYNKIEHDPMAVLVQYDGRLLHVWHLTDPFYRLRSGSRFAIKSKQKTEAKVIQFSDGAHIETDNIEALNTLMEKIGSIYASKTRFLFKMLKLFGGLALICSLAYVAWLKM